VQRHERTVRHRAERAHHHVQPTVRSTTRTPRTTTTRAERHEEFRRHERTSHRNGTQPNALAQPNAAITQPNGRAHRRAMRRHRAGAVTAQAARRGRFAAPFAAGARTAGARRARRYHYAARRAWRRGLRAAFIPWYGPVFWPYAYSDIFDYTFWPWGYEDGFWAFAYDDFIDGLFWGEAGPPDEYVEYAGAPPPRARRAAVVELCREPGTGITAWPFRDIERKLDLTSDQRALLDEVRDAAKKATSVFKDSCPSQDAYPLTRPGRLRAMVGRLQATLEAVETVRPPLEKFYNSLSDEQKERFNELGPARLHNNPEVTAALPADVKACKQGKPGLTALPIEQIDNVVQPSDEQEKLLDHLEDATDRAVAILQAACPNETPLTPPGRLEAAQTRLKAMVDAANTVKPALDDFYSSLSNEQKARFNRIGRELAKSGG
jgi:LTXXQ motif family protein